MSYCAVNLVPLSEVFCYVCMSEVNHISPFFQDGLDDSPDLLADDGGNSVETKEKRAVSVDLSDNSLVVEISDALSEKDKVKFTVHTKVS